LSKRRQNRKKASDSEKIDLPENLVKVIHTYFPKLGAWLSDIPDPRQPHKITYDLAVLLWLGILLFFFENRRHSKFKLFNWG